MQESEPNRLDEQYKTKKHSVNVTAIGKVNNDVARVVKPL